MQRSEYSIISDFDGGMKLTVHVAGQVRLMHDFFVDVMFDCFGGLYVGFFKGVIC